MEIDSQKGSAAIWAIIGIALVNVRQRCGHVARSIHAQPESSLPVRPAGRHCLRSEAIVACRGLSQIKTSETDRSSRGAEERSAGNQAQPHPLTFSGRLENWFGSLFGRF